MHIDADLMVEINRRARVMRAWYTRLGPALYDMTTARLSLTVRLLRAEAIEALPYGCVTWTIKATQQKYFLCFYRPCESILTKRLVQVSVKLSLFPDFFG